MILSSFIQFRGHNYRWPTLTVSKANDCNPVCNQFVSCGQSVNRRESIFVSSAVIATLSDVLPSSSSSSLTLSSLLLLFIILLPLIAVLTKGRKWSDWLFISYLNVRFHLYFWFFFFFLKGVEPKIKDRIVSVNE